MLRQRPGILTILLAACAGSAAGGGAGSTGGAPVERLLVAMGTTFRLQIEGLDRPTALRASERAVQALAAVEARLSTWREDSELAALNRAGVGQTVELSPELARDLHGAQHWWLATGGAFDPGIGALVAAWGLRQGGRRPAPAELAAALAGSGLRHLQLEGRQARRLHQGLLLEEGAFGKGAGLDAAAAALRRAGVRDATLDLGGQILVLGDRPRTFAITDPDRRERTLAAITIERGSLATAGNRERGLEVDGEKIGHLLDPRTGRPAADFGSITVWAPSAMDADCLATALFVMGPDRALRWAAREPDIELAVVERSAAGPRLRASGGLRGRLRAAVDSLAIEYFPPTDS